MARETASRRAAASGNRLSGLVPLVVVAMVVGLFARSCIQGLPFVGRDTLRPADRDLLDTGAPGTGGEPSPDSLGEPAYDGGGQVDPGSPAPGANPQEPFTPPLPDPDDLERMLVFQEPTCPPAAGAPERHLRWTEPPPPCLDAAATYTATLETSRGDIHIELDAENAPLTVNSFVFLARWRYYEGSDFHVVWPGDMIQAGYPLGYAHWSLLLPGYTIPDELPSERPYYPPYSVGIAHRGLPDTNGGVFFINLGDNPLHERAFTRFGQITDPESRAVVDAIDATGFERPADHGSPRPGEETIIHRVTVTED